MEKNKNCLEEGYKNQKDFENCFKSLKEDFERLKVELVIFQERRLSFLLDMADTIEAIEVFIESLDCDYNDFDEEIIAKFKYLAKSKIAGMKNKTDLKSTLDEKIFVNKNKNNSSDYSI